MMRRIIERVWQFIQMAFLIVIMVIIGFGVLAFMLKDAEQDMINKYTYEQECDCVDFVKYTDIDDNNEKYHYYAFYYSDGTMREYIDYFNIDMVDSITVSEVSE